MCSKTVTNVIQNMNIPGWICPFIHSKSLKPKGFSIFANQNISAGKQL
jgi:hypothetical protein